MTPRFRGLSFQVFGAGLASLFAQMGLWIACTCKCSHATLAPRPRPRRYSARQPRHACAFLFSGTCDSKPLSELVATGFGGGFAFAFALAEASAAGALLGAISAAVTNGHSQRFEAGDSVTIYT